MRSRAPCCARHRCRANAGEEPGGGGGGAGIVTGLGLALGALIGLSLGLLGGGGSILTVPIFVYVLGIAAKPAPQFYTISLRRP